MPQNRTGNWLLFLIVFSQFAGTSLWFTGNAVINDLIQTRNIVIDIAWITSAVLFGFISGTLVFAMFSIADKFQSSWVFFFSCLIAALFNFFILWIADSSLELFIFRFFTGFFLAGIYPVGMKIASDIFPKRTGNALGFLVGALVLGTAFPHLVKFYSADISFQSIITTSSLLAIIGGLCVMLFIPKYKTGTSQYFNPKAITGLFNSTPSTPPATGYFGHMWELYPFWAFIPFAIQLHNNITGAELNIPLYSFLIIAAGALGCIGGGIISRRAGSKAVASAALVISAACCLISPFILQVATPLFILFMLIWGIAVVADSPQFSALVATNVPATTKGTALTFVTSIGFFISIVSIQLLEIFLEHFGEYGFWLLVPGPILGYIFLRRK